MHCLPLYRAYGILLGFVLISSPALSQCTSAELRFPTGGGQGTHRETAESGTIRVVTNASCNWVVSASDSWVHFGTSDGPSSFSGSGPDVLSYFVDANPSGFARQAIIGWDVDGQTLEINQQGRGCTLTLDQGETRVLPPEGGSVSFQVEISTDCTWDVTTDVPWIQNISPTTGDGTDTVSFTVATNETLSTRTGTIEVIHDSTLLSLSYTQEPPCPYNLSPSTLSSVPVTGQDNISVAVTTGDICPWIPASTAEWLEIVEPGPGAGTGQMVFSVLANSSTESRQGLLVIGTEALAVNQEGCTYTLEPDRIENLASTGATVSIAVTTQGPCRWRPSGLPFWVTYEGPDLVGSATIQLMFSGDCLDPVEEVCNDDASNLPPKSSLTFDVGPHAGEILYILLDANPASSPHRGDFSLFLIYP